MSVARKIISNTIAQIVGKLAMVILGVAVVKIIAKYLSVEEVGQYTLIYEFLAFFGIAADMGLYTIAVREMSQDENKIPKIIGNVLSLRTILVILTMALSVIIAYMVPKYQGTYIPLGVGIASFTVFFTILNGTITSVLQTKLKMHIASFMTVLGKIISVLFMVYVVFWGFPNDKEIGFYMLLAAGIVGNLLMFLSTEYYVAKITPLKYRFDFDLWKEMMKKALPYGIALILSTVYFRMNSLLLYFMRGEEELGIYGIALRILEHFSVVPLYFMNSVLPVLTKALGRGESAASAKLVAGSSATDNSAAGEEIPKYQKIIKYSFDFLLAIAVPMVVGGVILAYPIIFVVSDPKFLSRVGEGFYGSDMALQILIVALLFQFLNILFSFILIALNKQAKLLYINGACVVISLILNVTLINYFGFRGAAITNVFSEFFILVCGFLLAKKYLSFKIGFTNAFKIIFCAAIMGVAIYFLQPLTYGFVQNWNLVVLVPVGMAIYTAMLFVTGVVDKNMIGLLKKSEAEKGDAVEM